MVGQPLLSVILPLFDDRDASAAGLASWRAQRYPADRFEVVVVATGSRPDLERQARQLLRPSDRLVQCPSFNEAALYNAGGAVARGVVLLFTELHVLAAPDALATLGLLSRHDDEGWAAWAFGVRDAIERCRGPLHELNAALLQCWQELAERSEMPNLTVSARRSPGEWPEKPSPELMQSDPGAPGS